MNTPYPSLRFATFLTVFAVILSCGYGSASGWQDDPFDPFARDDTDFQDTIDSPVELTDETDVDKSLSEGVRLIIRSVRDSNPSTPLDLARAIKSMLNIEQYNEAKRYLGLLMNSGADDRQIFELLQQMGPAFFLELRDQPKLRPEGLDYALRVFEAAKRAAYEPKRMQDLISKLSDEDRFVRSDAFRQLRQLGAPAAAAMLDVAADAEQKNELPYVQSALKQMGKPALLPMIGAVRADATVAQAIAVGVLSNIDSALATDALCRASVSNQVPESVRAIAAEAVIRNGLGSAYEIEQRIFERANDYLEGKIQLGSDSRGEVEIWNWNFKEQRLVSTRTSAEDAARFLAVDLARDVYQLNKLNPEYRQLQLLAVLDATKRVLGPNRFVIPAEISPYVPDLTLPDVDLALNDAIERELYPAAIGAAELVGQIGDASILSTPDGQPPSLVKAILTGQRHLQFAAAKSISELDPKSAFPGCSYVARFMSYLAGSQATGSGLAAHPSPEVAQRLASSISQIGLVSQTANSAQQLFDELNANPDINITLVADSYSHPHYQEIVQQIRRNWMTRLMPVGLIVRDDERERLAKLIVDRDPFTLVMPLTTNPKLLLDQIQRLMQLQQPWPVSNVQRDLHAGYAIEWINKVLAQPQFYRFYHLACYRDELVHLLHLRDSWQAKSEILSNLGTAAAQRELIDIAGESGLPAVDRKIVADAFAKSVKQSGILLTTAEIRQQYDRYNASRSQSTGSQDILASILNTIESRRAK